MKSNNEEKIYIVNFYVDVFRHGKGKRRLFEVNEWSALCSLTLNSLMGVEERIEIRL